MDAMRFGLEEDDAPPCRIEVASNWMIHAPKPLLSWAWENVGCMEITPDDIQRFFERGPLYDGPATMCLRRWGFWIDRFEQIGKAESGMSEEIRTAALSAAETMKTVEGRLANTL